MVPDEIKLVFNSSGFGWVDIPLDTDNPFDGATSYTIEMEFKTPEAPVILITSADEDGVGGVDHSTLYAVTGTTSGSSAGEGALYADIWWVDAAWSGDIVDHKDGNYHSVSMSYSPGVTSHFWNWKSDGIDNPGGGNEGSNNYTTDVSKHIVRIGSCANDDYTDDIGMLDLPGLKNFVGEIDYIRIIANDPPYTLYVDESASSGGDGLTWETAYIFLQDALTLANTSNMVKEIRVAQGTYIPDANSSNPDGSGDR